MLGREAEARDGYERAIALFERLVAENPARTLYRGRLAWSLRRRGLARRALGDPAGAAADARRALSLFEGLPSRSGEDSFEEGCCHALLAGLAGQDGAGVSAAEGKAETDQAMALLRKTVGMGYRDAPASGPTRPSTRSASGRTSRSCSPSWSRNRPPSRRRRHERRDAVPRSGSWVDTSRPGSARLWENNSKSVRHFSPGWGIESRSRSRR